MTPEHFSQPSPVPTRTRAQSSGSRSKNEHGRKALFATLRLVINRQNHFARHRFAIAKRRNERRHSKIFRSRASEADEWRIFRNDSQIEELAGRIDLHAEFDYSRELRSDRVVRIMEPFKLGAAAEEGLRTDEVTLLFQFRFFLVGKNAQARFSIDHFECDSAEKESVDGLVVIDAGNKNRPIQAADELALEQGRIGRLMIRPRVQDLARFAYG